MTPWHDFLPSSSHRHPPLSTVTYDNYLDPLSLQFIKGLESWHKQQSEIIQSFASVSQQNSAYNKMNMTDFSIMNLTPNIFISLQTLPYLLSFHHIS